MKIDPAELTANLIRCNSVTPAEGGAIQLLETLLSENGFDCHRCDRNGIANLYARTPSNGPLFGFGGHTDVVPEGDAASWTHPPFDGAIVDGELWGRGAVDMKSGVAAFVSAAIEYRENGGQGGIALLITGDEEKDAVDGTKAILDWMREHGETVAHCLVGEPTSPEKLGDMIKIGRRGSMTADFCAVGTQGHTAYPHRSANPLPPLMRLLSTIADHNLDDGG